MSIPLLALLRDVRRRFPGEGDRVARMSLVEEGETKHVRMANLAIVGSHSTNGVAAIHSALLRSATVKDLAEMFPERFNNKTNGVTPRRWLLVANPGLARTVTAAIGDGWITDLGELAKLVSRADDRAFRDAFRAAKRAAKSAFAEWLRSSSGQTVDVDSIFDCQVKRIHEYKRQLLNALRIAVLYNRLREDPSLDVTPRTFLFAGKAAPAYRLAKLVIKLLSNLASAIDTDPAVRGRLKVLFLPEYSVSLAERLIPAADVSNQISTEHVSGDEPGVFAPLRDTLLAHGDYYMHLADLASYLEADGRLCALYADPDAWTRMAILNVARSGKFSSDRTIAEYAADIWHAKPCPVS